MVLDVCAKEGRGGGFEDILGGWSGDDGIQDTRVEDVQLMEFAVA